MADATMRIIRQRALGGPEVLELMEVPRPDPGPTEVLVRVGGAGVNPVDWKTRQGGGNLGQPPFTIGWDVAGVVETVGRGVTRFEPGERVFGMPRFPREAAAYAEYVTSPSRQLARIPAGLDDVEAAALPLAGLTAWQDLVGSETSRRALPALRDGGIFITVPSASGVEPLRELAGGRVGVTGILVEPDRAGMEAIAGLAATGALRPHVTRTFPLEQAARAHELGETGRNQGKLVLTVLPA